MALECQVTVHSKHVKTLCGVLQIINTGVRSFVRCDNKSLECAFRLAQEVSLTAVIDVTLGQYCRLSGFSNIMYDFSVLLTVHHAMILGNCPT